MESKINLNHVVPINYKLTVTLVNQFVVSTVQFLNRFASRCDDKLRQVSEGMHRIDITLNILEAKLNSIPTASEQQQQPVHQAQPEAAAQAPANPSSIPPPPPPLPGATGLGPPPVHQETASAGQAAASTPVEPPAPPPPQGPLLKDDERFSKYFKMVKMGVPAAGVKQKMSSEGLDPSMLDRDPDSPAPPMPEGGLPPPRPVADSSDDADDEFSD